MPARNTVTDGNYRVEKQVGASAVTFPFFDKNDAQSFEISMTYRIDAASYRPDKPMRKINTQYGIAYLVDQSESTDAGNGVLQYTKTFASVPKSRLEATTITHSRQEIIGGRIIETQETVPAVVVYDYSLKPLAQRDAPRIIEVDGVYLTYGNFGNFVAGKLYLAEDSEVGIYKGKIYFRRGVLIRWKQLKQRN